MLLFFSVLMVISFQDFWPKVFVLESLLSRMHLHFLVYFEKKCDSCFLGWSNLIPICLIQERNIRWQYYNVDLIFLCQMLINDTKNSLFHELLQRSISIWSFLPSAKDFRKKKQLKRLRKCRRDRKMPVEIFCLAGAIRFLIDRSLTDRCHLTRDRQRKK